jgi:hypothetical protein
MTSCLFALSAGYTEQNQERQEELSDKDLSKKLHNIIHKAEGRGTEFFFLSFLPLLLPSPYFGVRLRLT